MRGSDAVNICALEKEQILNHFLNCYNIAVERGIVTVDTAKLGSLAVDKKLFVSNFIFGKTNLEGNDFILNSKEKVVNIEILPNADKMMVLSGEKKY